MTVSYLAAKILHGLSSDTKPTNVPDNTLFIETNTGDIYKIATGSWSLLNAATGGGGASTLDGLTDVTISSVAAHNILAYNSGTSQFINTTPIPIAYDYIISKISTTYYATKSGETIPKYSGTTLHTVVNNAATDLGATGGVVAFAANSTFILSGAPIALKDNITFRGMDRITSIIKNSTAHEIFRNNAGSGGAQLVNAGITDLHIIIHDPTTTESALYIDGSLNFKFNRNWVESKSTPSSPTIATFFDTHTLVNFHDNIEVKDNWWTGNNNGQDAFGNGNLRNGIVTGNTFKNHTDGQAIGAASPVFTIFANNTFHNVGNAIGFETVTEDCIISNNLCYNTTGIKMAGESTANISRRNLVTDNIIIYGNGGIEAGNCVNDTFINNKIIRTGTNGLRGSLNGCTIKNNEFIDTNHSNSTMTVNSISQRRGGIIIFNNTSNMADMDNNIIQGNKFIDTGASFTDPVSATSKSGNTGGIVLDTNCSSNLLIDNQFIGLPGDPVTDYGISTFRKDAGERSLFESMKGRYIEGELFAMDGGYGSGQFAVSHTSLLGTSDKASDSTNGLFRWFLTAATTGSKSGRGTNSDMWMRKWLPKIFIVFNMVSTTTQHALFIGLASVNDGTSVHATAPLPTMTGIGISVQTDQSNFRVAYNAGSASCSFSDTGVAKDTNRHIVEIWTDDTNWYYKFDAGATKSITSGGPAQTTKMCAVWHNLTNENVSKEYNLYKYLSRIIIPP